MPTKLYWFDASHPGQAVRQMLELKGVEYQSVKVLPGMQRLQMRLLGFPGGTVPGLKLNGRRIQGSRQIARALEELSPEPPLFPADPELRKLANEAERWGDEELQNVPRRLFRWGLARSVALRRWLSAASGIPAPGVAARTSGLNARYYARLAGADDAAVRRDLADLPGQLARVDRLLADGVLQVDPPNAAGLQVLSSVRALDALSDLHPLVSTHASAAPARDLFPDFLGPIPPFLPQEWLPAS
jgi:glutathione S-transferase